MYLSTVRIDYFRNFKSFAVRFQRGLNVIVGENNVGKTISSTQFGSVGATRAHDLLVMVIATNWIKLARSTNKSRICQRVRFAIESLTQ